MSVRPKKYLGQHFLKDKNIARKIVDALDAKPEDPVMEIGPGTGILTDFLIEKYNRLILVEKDPESVSFLRKKLKDKPVTILQEDFLGLDLEKIARGEPLFIIGNFPYNISSQILFKILDNKEWIPGMTGMFQKEVAERIAATPGNKNYGILSVLTRAYYNPQYLFTVHENVFHPPPKVKSGVIKLTRKKNPPDIDYKSFKHLVKSVFNKRRKTLRNSLKSANLPFEKLEAEILAKRPEQLSVEEFIQMHTKLNA